jgi:hypothetical protein
MNAFLKLVIEMRAAQKLYFRERRANPQSVTAREALIESKRLESEVDRTLRTFQAFERSQREHYQGEEQRNLFEP